MYNSRPGFKRTLDVVKDEKFSQMPKRAKKVTLYFPRSKPLKLGSTFTFEREENSTFRKRIMHREGWFVRWGPPTLGSREVVPTDQPVVFIVR